jgi:hypothetical protein
MDTNGFFAIERELQKRREQAISVSGKDTTFRVEFRYRHGCKHWQYFTCLEDCSTAKDSKCSYSIWGDAVIEHPLSRQIQKRGSRGGWKKYNMGKELTNANK